MKELRSASEYKSSKATSFPDEEQLTQKQRNTPDYYLHACNAIVSRYINNHSAIPYDNWGQRRSFSELRAYRTGRNNPNKYKGYICGVVNKELNQNLGIAQAKKDANDNKTTVNISWDVLQILPEKIDVVMGYLQKINWDVETQAIDYQALIGKKTMVAMAKLYADERFQFMKNQANTAAGREVIQDKDPSEMPGGAQFSSPKEVDVAAAVGVFFLEQEAAIQTLLTKSAEESNSDVLNDLYKNDMVTLGIAAKRVYTNQNTNMVLEDYEDPDMAMFPWSVYNDYRDMTWYGGIKTYTIGRLRKELKIPEDELIKIAKMYASNDNGSMGYQGFYYDVQRQRNNSDFGMNMMDNIEVDVADCVWFGIKSSAMTAITRENEGNLAVNTVDDDYKLTAKDERKGKSLYNFENRTVYKAKMVMGTSFVFDYGEDTDIAYSRNNAGKFEPIFPRKVVRTGNISLVERCIGFVDDANLSNYKLRVARMKMPAPPNVFVDESMLQNLSIGGVTWSPQRAMRTLMDEGFLVGKTKDFWGKANAQGTPISNIGTDVISFLLAWREDREDSIRMIEKVTAINDVFSAQTPQSKQAVGVTNNLIAATQNAFTPIVKANQYLFEGGERLKVKKWQVVSTYMTEEERKRLSINRALKVIKIGSDLQDFDFDITLHAAITDQQRAEMLQDIRDMRNLRIQAGSGGINESDYILLYNMIMHGKFIQAQLAMAQIIESREREDEEKKDKLVQQNQQAQAQSNQQAQQGEAQNIQMEGKIEGDNKIKEIITKGKVDAELEILRAHNERMKSAIDNIYGSHKKKSA
jgi:hypothetical protein